MFGQFFGENRALVGSPVNMRTGVESEPHQITHALLPQGKMGVIVRQTTGPELSWPQKEGNGNKYQGMLSVS